MSDLQIFVFAGNLGKDPEMRYTPSGQAVCAFSLASNRQWKNDKDETCKVTTWLRVSTWGKLAEICAEYLQRGSKVTIEGRLEADKETGGPRIWTDQAGNPRTSFEVTATSVHFLSPKTERAEPAAQEEAPF